MILDSFTDIAIRPCFEHNYEVRAFYNVMFYPLLQQILQEFH
jgi:hypothetical protein